MIGVLLYSVTCWTIPRYGENQGKLDNIARHTRENLDGVRVIRAFSRQDEEIASYRNDCDVFAKRSIAVGRVGAILNPASFFIMNMGIVAVLWFGGIRVDTGHLTQGELTAFVNYMTQIALSMVRMAELLISFNKAAASAKRVSDILAEEPDITNGKELPGAKLEIRDADGNLVEGWTSGKVPHTVRGLELEKAYTLTETRAPDGYTEAESIVFELVQEGTEQVNEVYVKSDDDWSKMNGSTIVMQDAPVLDIDKTDIAGNLLPGATLTIRDANDEVVDTWTTDYKTHSVPISDEFIKLSDGNKEYIYTLTEDAAPAGFEIAESVQFKVQQEDETVCLFVRKNADAEWVRADKRLIQMIDEAMPREDTPTPTPQPTPAATPVPTPAPTPVIAPRKVQTLPQTGDGFPLLSIVVVSLASATGIVLLTVKQRNALKETSDKEDADESSDR